MFVRLVNEVLTYFLWDGAMHGCREAQVPRLFRLLWGRWIREQRRLLIDGKKASRATLMIGCA